MVVIPGSQPGGTGSTPVRAIRRHRLKDRTPGFQPGRYGFESRCLYCVVRFPRRTGVLQFSGPSACRKAPVALSRSGSLRSAQQTQTPRVALLESALGRQHVPASQTQSRPGSGTRLTLRPHTLRRKNRRQSREDEHPDGPDDAKRPDRPSPEPVVVWV